MLYKAMIGLFALFLGACAGLLIIIVLAIVGIALT